MTANDINLYKAIVFYFLVVVTLFLVPFLLSIGVNKRKYVLYSEQISASGRITEELPLLRLLLDRNILSYALKGVPGLINPQLTSDMPVMVNLHRKIDMLTLIAKQIAVALVAVTITLMVLIALF